MLWPVCRGRCISCYRCFKSVILGCCPTKKFQPSQLKTPFPYLCTWQQTPPKIFHRRLNIRRCITGSGLFRSIAPRCRHQHKTYKRHYIKYSHAFRSNGYCNRSILQLPWPGKAALAFCIKT